MKVDNDQSQFCKVHKAHITVAHITMQCFRMCHLATTDTPRSHFLSRETRVEGFVCASTHHLGCIQAFPLPSCPSAMFLIPCCHSQNPQQATGKYNPSYNTLGTIYESYAALQSQYLIHADPICSKKLCFNTVSPPKHTQTSCLSEHR